MLTWTSSSRRLHWILPFLFAGIVFSYPYSTSEGDILHLKGEKLTTTGTIWKNAVVSFQISEMFSQRQLYEIIYAMAEVEANTCVRFNNSRSGAFVNILPSDRCGSFVGNIGHHEGQILFLSTYNCFKRSDILHQLLHVLAFQHEHNRPERDQYISINTDNIKEDRLPFFKKHTIRDPRSFNWPYNYNTIMHAKSHDYARNKNLPTVEAKVNSTEVMGGGNGLTPIDIERINALYKCSEMPLKPKFTDAYRPGYVGGSCSAESAPFRPDPTNCLHYLECVDGRYLSRSCPSGSSYHASDLICAATDMTKCG